MVKGRVTSSELHSVTTIQKKKNENIFQKLIIRKDNTQKAFFDIMMMFVSCYATVIVGLVLLDDGSEWCNLCNL